jgi:hypothetical protein
MTKYGFIRWPEEDFSDDGARFTCYRVGERVRVSKTTYQGEVFISARIDGRKLSYNEYSALKHYRALDKLNGILICRVTDQDLLDLYEACLAYEIEYNKAEKALCMPTFEQIKEQALLLHRKRVLEASEASLLVSKHLMTLVSKLSDYGWKELRNRLVSLKNTAENFDVDRYARSMLDTRMSIELCKPDSKMLKDSWEYEALVRTVQNCI